MSSKVKFVEAYYDCGNAEHRGKHRSQSEATACIVDAKVASAYAAKINAAYYSDFNDNLSAQEAKTIVDIYDAVAERLDLVWDDEISDYLGPEDDEEDDEEEDEDWPL